MVFEMVDDIDRIKCMVYQILTVRYKHIIAKNEEKNLSQLKEKIAPFSDEIVGIASRILSGAETDNEKFSHVLSYLRKITVVELAIPFYLSFREVDNYMFATPLDKAMLGASLMRKIGIDAKVYMTKQNTYIGFRMNNTPMLLNVSSMVMLQGKEADDAFLKDPLRFVFNDMYSEVFE